MDFFQLPHADVGLTLHGGVTAVFLDMADYVTFSELRGVGSFFALLGRNKAVSAEKLLTSRP
jgi:hypothetical protein